MNQANRIETEKYDRVVVIYAACFTCWRALMLILPLSMAINNTRAGSLLKALFYASGIGLLVIDYIRHKRVLFGTHIVWLFALALSLLLAECIHYKYSDYFVLLKQYIRSTILIFLLYTAGMRMTRRGQMRFLLILHSIFSVVFIPAMCYMFYQFLTLKHYVMDTINQGWYEGRLYGIMVSPYAGAMIAVILAFGSVFLFRFSDRKIYKALYGADLIICIIFLALSDTRTAYVACAMGIALVVLWCGVKPGLKRDHFCRIGRSILAYLLILVAMFALLRGIRTAGLYCTMAFNKEETEPFSEFTENQERPPQTFTSRRAFIWRSYLDVLTDDPTNILFGLSLSGSSSYIRKNYPETYIVEDFKYLYPEYYEKGYVYATHNTYLTVLVYSGVIGLGFLLVFLLKCALDAMGRLMHNKLSSFEVLVTTLILMILTAGLFESDPFFNLSNNTCIFWICAGFLMNAPKEKV